MASAPPPAEQRALILRLDGAAPPLAEGQLWYVLHAPWWKRWRAYVSYDEAEASSSSSSSDSSDSSASSDAEEAQAPGPISNAALMDETGQVKRNLVQNWDFVIVSAAAWAALVAWYGGGPPLARRVITTGWREQLVVDVRPLALKAVTSAQGSVLHTFYFSRADRVAAMKAEMCARLELDPESVRVWDFHGRSLVKLLNDPKERLDDAQMMDGQLVLLESAGPDGVFRDAAKDTRAAASFYSYGSGGPCTPGTTGLANLGNTCFMNSALQSLTHAAPLTAFFLTGAHTADINATNPLGCNGELAAEYARLVTELWSGAASVFSPREFKARLERFAPQFAGYQQHDAQELLAFLLDGLHEDLNRRKTKPYVEAPVSDGRPDADVAAEAWAGHKARNDSVIVDWFQGQLKSRLVCPKCGRVSVTFDPFMYLSLPLRVKSFRNVTLTFVWRDGRPPVRLTVQLQKSALIADLRAAISALTAVPADCIAVADVYYSRFFKLFAESEALDAITDRDLIHAYELAPASPAVIHVPLLLRRDEPARYAYSAPQQTLLGTPLVLSLPADVSRRQLYAAVAAATARFFRPVPLARPLAAAAAAAADRDALLASSGGDRSARDDTTEEDITLQPRAAVADQAEAAAEEGEGEEEEEEEGEADGEEEEEEEAGEEDEEEGEVEGEAEDERATDERGQGEASEGASDDERRSTAAGKRAPLSEHFVLRLTDVYGTDLRDDEQLDGVADDAPLGLQSRQSLAMHLLPAALEAGALDADAEKAQTEHASVRGAGAPAEEELTLGACIEQFTAEEVLSAEDPWYCATCKEHQQASKKFDLWSVPRILVVHLKRFSYKNKYYREKLDNFVDFPVTGLDLSAHLRGPVDAAAPPLYDLFAVSNHYGSLGGGHYTAFARNDRNGRWYKFDDSHVAECAPDDVRSSAAYVLYYQRRDAPATPAPSPPAPTAAAEPPANV